MKEGAKKLEDLFRDESFVTEMMKQNTPEEAQVFLAAHGVECTLEEVKAMGKAMKAAAQAKQTGEELSEDELEDVSGGSVLLIAGGIAAGIAYLVGVPLAGGAVISWITGMGW